ncbi:MAG: class I SAM-dependent methyltransferase [Isosphaeraceae bacterium]
MTPTLAPEESTATSSRSLMRCVGCGASLVGEAVCRNCGRATPESQGIHEAIILPLEGRNRVAHAFYESKAWRRFQPWERVFLFIQGPGEASARRQVLWHLGSSERKRILEVGIGDGANVPLLPTGWELHGLDFSKKRLERCRDRWPSMAGRLTWGEAERLPFEDAAFDGVFTVGGINYFRDPFVALAEMRRVTRPGGVMVAADERADLFRLSLGHALGLEWLDVWSLRLMGLDPKFLDMVLHDAGPVEAAAHAVWPRHRRVPIWNRLGYCLVDVG